MPDIKRRYYISFAGDPPVGFVGACVVFGSSPEDALDETERLGICPRSGVEAMAMDIGTANNLFPMNKLLTKDEIYSCDGGARRLGEITPEERALLEKAVLRFRSSGRA